MPAWSTPSMPAPAHMCCCNLPCLAPLPLRLQCSSTSPQTSKVLYGCHKTLHRAGQAKNLEVAFELVREMAEARVQPDRVTYTTLVDQHAEARRSHRAVELMQVSSGCRTVDAASKLTLPRFTTEASRTPQGSLNAYLVFMKQDVLFCQNRPRLFPCLESFSQVVMRS